MAHGVQQPSSHPPKRVIPFRRPKPRALVVVGDVGLRGLLRKRLAAEALAVVEAVDPTDLPLNPARSLTLAVIDVGTNPAPRVAAARRLRAVHGATLALVFVASDPAWCAPVTRSVVLPLPCESHDLVAALWWAVIVATGRP
jgi:hypothetical protein